jgi:uncharacterized membrane protein YjjP (DUF1212 family)
VPGRESLVGDSPLTDVPLDEASRFIVRVGTEARRYGAAAPRVADYLRRLAACFGLREAVLSWPNHMLFVVEDRQRQRQRVDVERLPSSSASLGKLADVGAVVDEVVAGEVSTAQGMQALEDIGRAPMPWDPRAVAVSYAVIGLGLAVLLRGSWLDAGLGAVLAVVVYGMVLAAGRLGVRTAEWLPLATAFVPSVVATTVRHWYPGVDVLIVTISAIAVLLPGYAVSVGIGELVEDHVIAGWSNLLRGLVYLSKQVLGMWLGAAVVRTVLDPPPSPATTPVPEEWLWLFMPLLIVGLCVVFQTSRRDFVWAVLSCGLAYGVSLVASDVWTANLGTLVATAVVAVFSNLWARRSRRPTSIVLVPAIVVLVSGSIGFQGLAAIAEGQTTIGVQQFVQMFVIAVMLTAGLLVGNTIVRPRATL